MSNIKCSICGSVSEEKELTIGNFFKKKCMVFPCKCNDKKLSEYELKIKKRDIWLKSNIPPEFSNGIEGWNEIDGTQEAFNGVKNYIKNIDFNYKNKKSILLIGNSGTGKTRLSATIGIEYIRNLKKVKYISLSKLLVEIETYKGSRGFLSYIDKYIDYDVLVLDDIGESDVSKNYHKYIFSLLDGRKNKRKITIMNTMRNCKDLTALIGEHNVSRILGMAGENVYQITSKRDMRLDVDRN